MVKKIRSLFNNGSWFKVKADTNIKPEEYTRYFEDWI